MAPLQLEGETLGMKQKHLNILVEQELKEGLVKPGKIKPEGNDLENLLTIEIACKTKNLEVILDVLKGEDMLYVSRAIKHSTWIIADPQYAHIINPEYLHSQLFPHMTLKACSKLLLHIRLNLKDEARVDNFYHYFKKKDQIGALKWLQNCSIDVMQKEVEDQYNNIEIGLLKRLCEKSITVLETYIQKSQYYKRNALKSMMFLINDHTEKFLDLVEKVEYYDKPSFSPKATSVIMKKCPQRLLDNFEKYCDKIDLPTFTKYLKGQDVKGFLQKQTENDKMKGWFKYENIKHFIRYIPKDGRFDFLKTMFIEKSHMKSGSAADFLPVTQMAMCSKSYCAAPEVPSTSANIYRWYKFAPFQTAFPDLKKLIRSESSPSERIAMLAILLSCANRNQEHINELLQYFHDKHINEPFKFKLQFVNMVITQTNTWAYDEKAWNNLNNIFHSMEVYTESENNVQICIHCIIVKKVLHYESVPDIIEKKFIFDTLKKVQKNLSPAEKDKIFTYLTNILLMKIKNVDIQNEADFSEVVQLLEELLTLILDYKKVLSDFPNIIAKIKKLVQMKVQKSWKTDMLCLYDKRKSWRRYLFEESLVMCPSEGACLNALKHEPELLMRHANAVKALQRDDAVSLCRVLAKLRVYWSESLATEWANGYLAQLETQGGHKAIVRGLCTLLPLKQLTSVIKKYEPSDIKINWSEDDQIILSVRKQFAKNMYIARPVPSPDTVLPFARGDYLQFAIPSLAAILYNISPIACREYIPKLLKAPVSLQKHGIRLAFIKLESAELQKVLSDVWKSTKNLSIRAVLFKQTYQLLCNEKDPTRIEETWKLLEAFIENLSQEENRIIYDLLGKVNKVPLQVRAKYCMKAYTYLKSLPPKANCESLVEKVINCTRDIMESLEPNFVINILQESLEKKFTTKSHYDYLSVMSAFLLCTEETKSQIDRYEKLLAPLLESCLSKWETKADGKYVIKNNVTNLLKQLSGDIPQFVFEKRMVFPVQLFASIQEKLVAKLTIQSNYVLLKTWDMIVNFIKILEPHKSILPTVQTTPTCNEGCGPDSDNRWDKLFLKASPAFATYIIQLLKEEMKHHFSSVYLLVGKALEDMVFNMGLNQNIFLEIFINILDNRDFVECNLLVLTALPEYLYGTDDEVRGKLKKIKQILRCHPSIEVKMHYYLKTKSMDDDESN